MVHSILFDSLIASYIPQVAIVDYDCLPVLQITAALDI